MPKKTDPLYGKLLFVRVIATIDELRSTEAKITIGSIASSLSPQCENADKKTLEKRIRNVVAELSVGNLVTIRHEKNQKNRFITIIE